jgi:predicted adenine nucleotide alpha hydrolase (AANH) superfamily ATPase
MLEYFRAVVGHESDRCRDCYRLRLAKTAEVAQQRGLDAFTTTLLISPYQRHHLIREIGDELANVRGVRFHFEDFSPGFRESHRLSRELGLYHQGYCGCVYSEWERYGKVKI